MVVATSGIVLRGELIPADKVVWEQSGLSPLEKIDRAALRPAEDSILNEFDSIDVLCYAGLGERIRTFSRQYHQNFPSEQQPFVNFPDLQQIQFQYTQEQEKSKELRNVIGLFVSVLRYAGAASAFIGGAVAGGELSKESEQYIASIVAAFTGVVSVVITSGLFNRFDKYLGGRLDGRQQKRETDLEQHLLDALNSYKSARTQ